MLYAWEKEVMAVASYLLDNEDPQVKGVIRFLKEVSCVAPTTNHWDTCYRNARLASSTLYLLTKAIAKKLSLKLPQGFKCPGGGTTRKRPPKSCTCLWRKGAEG